MKYTKQSLKDKLNKDLVELGLEVQKISKEYHQKSKLASKSLFGEIRDGGYAFHIGGFKELQFNLGWHDNKFRYGLAFSIQENQSLPDPVSELKPFIDFFNNIETNKKEYNLYKYGGGGKALNEVIDSKKIDNTLDTFWFYGQYIDWNDGDIDDKKYEIIVKTFENLFNTYKEVMNGAKKMKIINKKTDLLKNRKQIILQGPPGTGKTRLAKQIAISMVNNGLAIDENKDSMEEVKDQVKLIQFHPSYSYEDFVRGIVAKTNGSSIEYKTEDKVLVEMAKKALNDKEKKSYILIIDEINRANLSSVLGELIYALEYRDEVVESMYDIDGDRDIVLPSNLYIIGTMNTADRSVGHIDYAIRRRFAFETISPDKDIIVSDKGKELFRKVETIFEATSPEFDKDDVMLGHSYFMVENELKEKLEYQIKPLLMEYIKDGVLIDTEDLREKIKKL